MTNDSHKKASAANSGSSQTEKRRGKLYWFRVNLGKRLFNPINDYMDKKPLRSALAILVLTWAIFLWQRQEWHILVIAVRKNLEWVVLGPLIAWVAWMLLRSSLQHKMLGLVARIGLAILLIVGSVEWGGGIHTYLAYWWGFGQYTIVELDKLPPTDKERVHPTRSVASQVLETMQGARAPSDPDYVRNSDGRYSFTMVIEPKYRWQIWSGFSGHVEELIEIPGSSPSVVVMGNKVPVSFDVSEHRWLSHSTHTCTVRGFGLWRFLNYEPSNVLYLKDDRGEYVQVVTLIRWKGILVPRPEFGGVQVIRQHGDSPARSFQRVVFGCGEWIPPEEIHKHKYLVGQNLLSDVVARWTGESFRFKNGFFAPFPGSHEGDMCIPDLPSVVDSQPFTAHFTMPGKKAGKLYRYFALEPYDDDKQGLIASVFLPADGQGPVFMYDHVKKGETLIGVSAVEAKVRVTRKNYQWDKNRPVEHRPVIRNLFGENRLFWLTTVVTLKEQVDGQGSAAIAGNEPELALTDAKSGYTVWVDPAHPETWTSTIEKGLVSSTVSQ